LVLKLLRYPRDKHFGIEQHTYYIFAADHYDYGCIRGYSFNASDPHGAI
jgi:hypothetical protein